MLWHLLGEYVKATVLLVCSICTVHRFFFLFPVIDLCSFFYSIFALFIQRFSLFIYSSILVSHFVFFFFKVLNISYSSKRHCSYNSYFFFFFPFQSSVCTFFFLLYILLYIQCFCAVHLHSTVPFCWANFVFFFFFEQ